MEQEKAKKLYTKTGDNGTTRLMKIEHISKDDARIELLGSIDELTSHIGVSKTLPINEDIKQQLNQIQINLMTIMAGIADAYQKDHRLAEEEIEALEVEIDRVEGLFEREKHFIIPGENSIAAQLDVCRSVARRAERRMISVDRKYGVDKNAKKYCNRLADYLYIIARYLSSKDKEKKDPTILPTMTGEKGALSMNENNIIQAVLERLTKEPAKITLQVAKRLIEVIEEEAKKRGVNAVIAICGADGNMIAVHVMDDAFLASFDVAMKKAYTSVAVRMSTKELGVLALPGGTFYGVDKADNNRLIVFGGGVPIKVGDTLLGGIGVSGASAEDDDSLAHYGLEQFIQMESF